MESRPRRSACRSYSATSMPPQHRQSPSSGLCCPNAVARAQQPALGAWRGTAPRRCRRCPSSSSGCSPAPWPTALGTRPSGTAASRRRCRHPAPGAPCGRLTTRLASLLSVGGHRVDKHGGLLQQGVRRGPVLHRSACGIRRPPPPHLAYRMGQPPLSAHSRLNALDVQRLRLGHLDAVHLAALHSACADELAAAVQVLQMHGDLPLHHAVAPVRVPGR